MVTVYAQNPEYFASLQVCWRIKSFLLGHSAPLIASTCTILDFFRFLKKDLRIVILAIFCVFFTRNITFTASSFTLLCLPSAFHKRILKEISLSSNSFFHYSDPGFFFFSYFPPIIEFKVHAGLSYKRNLMNRA